MRGEPLLDVRNLRAFYGRAQVLFGLSLHLYPGEVVALVGRNGAGKTTTLKAIMGLISATATHATFKSHSLGRLPTYKIARLGLGYVPEDRRIFTDLTVEENLETGRRPAGADRSPWTPERLFRLFPTLPRCAGGAATRCPVASSRCSPLPAPSWAIRMRFSSTSPPRASPR